MGNTNHGAEAMAGDLCPNQGEEIGEAASNGEEVIEDNQNQNQGNEEEEVFTSRWCGPASNPTCEQAHSVRAAGMPFFFFFQPS